MGKYDSIMTKQADVQYKHMLALIASANEENERNHLLRIQLAIALLHMPAADLATIELAIGEDLDLTEQN